MADWRQEFDRRCRRVLGIVDDAQPVRVWTSAFEQYESMGPEAEIEVSCGTARRDWSDLGELIRELDEVSDD